MKVPCSILWATLLGMALTTSAVGAKRSVIFNPVKQGVVHRPQTPGSSPRKPAVVNVIPPRDAVFDSRGLVLLPSYGYYYGPSYRQDYDFDRYDIPIRSLPRAPVVEVEEPDLHPLYRAGRDWGQDLRRDVVSWETFVAYFRRHLREAPELTRELFRRGFLAGYGTNAEAAWLKLNQSDRETSSRTGPVKLITPYGTVESR